MKILLVNKYHFVKGGSETYHFGLGDLLTKNGHQVIYFSMKDEKNFPCEQSDYFIKNVDFYNNKSIFKTTKAAFHALYSFEAKRKIEALIKAERPDIIHINLAYRHLTFSILETIKKYNIPVVLTMHDLNCICPNNSMMVNGAVCDKCVAQHSYAPCLKQKCIKGSFLQSLLGVIEAKNYKRLNTYNKIDFYICPSNFYRKQLIRSGLTESPVVHWVNFLPPTTQYKLSTDTKDYFLYFGRLTKEKGVLTLIKAYQKGNFANPLYIVGTGDQMPQLKEYVTANNLENKVIFTGFQQGEALKRYVREAKCVILPSEWYENGPYAILEAMSMGKPAIVSNYGGLPEIVDDGKNGYVFEAYNADALYDCLKKMNNLSPEEYTSMCQHSLDKAVESCNCDSYYEKLIKCYQNLVSNAKGGSL